MEFIKPCPFCGAPMTLTQSGDLWAWHSVDCFFQLLDESNEVDMNEEEIKKAFVEAWNRRAEDGRFAPSCR